MLFFDKTKCRLLTLCSTAVLLAACGGGGSSSDSDSDSPSTGSEVESTTNDNTTDDSTVVDDSTDDSTTDDSTSDDTVAEVAAITTSTTVSLKATDTLVLPEKLEVVNAEEDAETISSKMSFKASFKATFEESGTDYTNAPQHIFTWTEALQPIEKVNSILCFTSQFNALDFVNAGPYLVWVDEDNCFDNSGEGESTSSQTSQSQGGQSTSEDNRTTYTEVVVKVTREEGSALIVDAWIPDSEGGGDDEDGDEGMPQAIKFRATVVEGATDDDPFGQFRFNYNFYPSIDSTDSFGGGEVRTVAALDGFIGFTMFEGSEMSFGEFSMSSSESASVVMSDDMSEGVALTSTYRDEGGWTEGAAYGLAFDEDYVLIQDGDDYGSLAFRAQDDGGSSGTCLSRTSFNEQVWRYSLFHAETGAAVELNSGFPFRYDSNGDGENDGHGFLDYWGMWTDGNTGVDDGTTVVRENWDRGEGEDEVEEFTVLKAPGRLIKNSVEALPLDQLKGVELMYWDNSAFASGYDEWVVKYQSVADDGVAVDGLYVVAGLSWPQHDDMGGGGRGGEEPGEEMEMFECPEGEDCSHMTMIECAEGEECQDMFMCPEGEDCSDMTAFECPPGEDCGDMFMCPEGEDCSDIGMFECPPGEVCDMDIVFCPEGEDCSGMTKLECPEGETCPDMFICAEGDDCSDMTAFECPPGADCGDMFMCPEGEDCSDMSIFHECPEGEVCEEPSSGSETTSIKQAIAAASDPETTATDSTTTADDGTMDDGKMEGDGGEGFQDFGPTKTAITPVLLTVDDGGFEGNDIVHMYAHQLGGGVQYKIGADAVRFFRETNITGSEEDFVEGKLDLLCYMECPKGTLGADQLADWEGDSSPYEAFPESLDDAISYSVSNSGDSRMTLVRTSNSEPVKYSSDVSRESLESAGSPFAWGVRTGPMVTAAVAADLQTPWDVHNPDLVDEFYIWETGLDEWHQMVTVIDANGDVVALDKPMEFNYQHSDTNDRTGDAGDYDGQTFLIGYMGNGNMWGIPHGQIGEGRWAPIFSIADGALMGSNDEYVIKALDVERKMARAEDGCTDLVINNPAAPIPTGLVDEVEIGVMPEVESGSPSVIGGETQGSSTVDAE